MRTTLLALALLFAAQTAAADVAPAATDTFTTAYTSGGLRVIHRRIDANEIVAVNLYLLGGSAQLDAQNAGIEALLLRASEYGTAAYPGQQTRVALARTGSRTLLDVDADWTLFGFRGLRSEFDSTWSVFAERVLHPALDSAAIELVRNRMLIARRSRTRNPDALVRTLMDSVAFAEHPYRHDPEGTETSLQGITAAALRSYHETQFVTSRMLLVVVGNVTREQVEAAIARTFAQLPAGAYTWQLPPAVTSPKAAVTVVEQQLPTNYILGYYGGPASTHRDYLAFVVATRVLGAIAYGGIRSAGLSYVADAPLLERAAATGGVYVSTTRPDTAMGVFRFTIEMLGGEGSFSRAVLNDWYESWRSMLHRMTETNEGQADFLARYELLHGGWEKSTRYMQDLRNVSGYDIKRVVRQYVKNLRYVYLGDANRVPWKQLGVKAPQ